MSGIEHDPDRGFQAWIPFFRQWKIGCLFALLIFAGACALIVSIQPTYRAHIQLVLPIKLIADPANRKSTGSTPADAYVVKSYADMLNDDGLARKVIHDLKLADNPEFNPPPTLLSSALQAITSLLGKTDTDPLFNARELNIDRVLQDYLGRLKATNESKALTVMLSFDAHDPRLAQKVVTAHAQAFVQGEIDYRRQDAATKVAWMKSELDRTTSEARDAQVALQLNPATSYFSRDASAGAVSNLKMKQLQATGTQAVYDSVLKHYQDMVSDEGYEGSEIRVLSSATLPTHPYFPKKALSAAVAALISVVLGCIAAAVASLIRRKTEVAALALSFGLPILAHLNIPRWPFGQRGKQRRTLFWQRVHELRSTIQVTEKRHPVIVVASALPKEGKSLVASALARSLSSGGLRTLLIDLNSRNPRYALSIDPRHRNSIGLQDYLEGSVDATRAAVKVDASTPLFIMSNNKTKPTDISSLAAAKLRSRLVALKKDFEVIVIDTPAMESLADVFQLVGAADEVILTAPSDQARPALQTNVAKLQYRAARLKGLVLIDEKAPTSKDVARIAGYHLPEHDFDVWPRRPRASNRFISLISRMIGRNAVGKAHAQT